MKWDVNDFVTLSELWNLHDIFVTPCHQVDANSIALSFTGHIIKKRKRLKVIIVLFHMLSVSTL